MAKIKRIKDNTSKFNDKLRFVMNLETGKKIVFQGTIDKLYPEPPNVWKLRAILMDTDLISFDALLKYFVEDNSYSCEIEVVLNGGGSVDSTEGRVYKTAEEAIEEMLKSLSAFGNEFGDKLMEFGRIV